MEPRMKMVWGEARRNSKNEIIRHRRYRKEKRKNEGISLKKEEGKQH